ncbi:carboxymuconolactone decarboxylase family protein [Thalassobius sp. Cn5-15]|jgi:AhpD family alkylhydroperoxidase|uniref:carboxymuconolactone decarboxylase family protein n=1 Tax=Thalassobius sp. Cn5-15 TaxID=2917763 RepID=UPI001EF29672|nr:carboxymuconolactone decarboxylase family protein [Thalassobius sp. Cn5-15]MCG7492574.1 carboxymuconolactone decarboxylase family protein [Thalassobius sp. Cn5-15]
MSWNDKFTDIKSQLRNLNGAIPETTKAFGALGATVKGDGALEHKTKEFVALGIAVASRCEPCIMFHVDALIRAGASREEVGETLAMAIQMGGGPSMMYASKALECFDELSAK